MYCIKNSEVTGKNNQIVHMKGNSSLQGKEIVL